MALNRWEIKIGCRALLLNLIEPTLQRAVAGWIGRKYFEMSAKNPKQPVPKLTSCISGKFHSQREAEKWIEQHRWLLAQRQEPDVEAFESLEDTSAWLQHRAVAIVQIDSGQRANTSTRRRKLPTRTLVSSANP